MKEEIKEYEPVKVVKFYTAPRMSGNGKGYTNLYCELDGHRFELITHCRTKRETAYFYKLLSRSSLVLNKQHVPDNTSLKDHSGYCSVIPSCL